MSKSERYITYEELVRRLAKDGIIELPAKFGEPETLDAKSVELIDSAVDSGLTVYEVFENWGLNAEEYDLSRWTGSEDKQALPLELQQAFDSGRLNADVETLRLLRDEFDLDDPASYDLSQWN